MNARILILDDEESIRFTFTEFLSDEGHQVVATDNMAEAQGFLQKDEFDLIFSDIVMPGGSGIDFLHYCRQHHEQIPVVMITGFPTMDTATAALRQGAYDYIAKPVTQTSLLKVTRMALQYKTLHDEKRNYQAHLEAVFRSVKDAIIAVDRQLRVIAVNDAAITNVFFLGREIGASILVDATDNNSSCVAALRKTIDQGVSVEVPRLKIYRDDDTEVVVTLNTAPLLKDSGELIGAVVVVRDESRLHALECKLNERTRFHRMIGASDPMQAIYGLMEKLEQVPTTVLITGESGTGKELIVEALHHRGVRKNGPLIKVNCSALTENLLESELFGHVRGAFTGAVKDNPGRFERAHGGTIFLDEIGDISLRMQVRLLRVLQEKIIERVGDATPVPVDVRVIAATHQDLGKKIKRGEFREDLFYRLNVVTIVVPPLRERRTDIPLLVQHFIELFNARFSKQIRAISADVERLFFSYTWPGNIRELEHVMEHAFILCRGDVLDMDGLPPELRKTTIKPPTAEMDLSATIRKTLTATDGNKAKAARLLNMGRRTLYRKIKDLDIHVD